MDFNFTSNVINTPNFVLAMDSLQLRPIHFPVGTLNDTFLEDKETFEVFILTDQNYKLNPARDRAIVTICDTTCKNLFKHICIYTYM